MTKELEPTALKRACDPEQFSFESTADLPATLEVVGQSRATAALRLGFGIKHDGFNIFALGSSGTGKRFLVEHELAAPALAQPIPKDLCYVNNFAEPTKPTALFVPAGIATNLHNDLINLLEEISNALPAAFESDDYQARVEALQTKYKEQHRLQFEGLAEEARNKGFAMLSTPMGMMFAPIVDNKVVSPGDFERLPEEKKKTCKKKWKACRLRSSECLDSCRVGSEICVTRSVS